MAGKAGDPYSFPVMIRVEAAEAFDGFEGATISDRMITAAAELKRLREGSDRSDELKALLTAADYAVRVGGRDPLRRALEEFHKAADAEKPTS